MKKKIILGVIIGILLMVIIVILGVLCKNMHNTNNVLLNCKSVSMAKSDIDKITSIINKGKKLSSKSGVPSCGFEKKKSIRLGKRTYYIALDDCDLLKYKKSYISVEEKNIIKLNNILKKYDSDYDEVHY